jgi:hypothetical protein
MNVKDNSTNKRNFSFHLMSFLFGAGKTNNKSDKELRLFVISATVILWSVLSLIAVGIFYFGSGLIFVEVLIDTLMVASLVGIGVSILSVIGKSDWNNDYGHGLFLRSFGYNVGLFILTIMIGSGVGMKEYREPVKEFQFMTTDVTDCQYKITMVSENLTYDYCSDYNTEYQELSETKDIDAMLVGSLKYGSNKANHVEFIKRKVVKG